MMIRIPFTRLAVGWISFDEPIPVNLVVQTGDSFAVCTLSGRIRPFGRSASVRVVIAAIELFNRVLVKLQEE